MNTLLLILCFSVLLTLLTILATKSKTIINTSKHHNIRTTLYNRKLEQTPATSHMQECVVCLCRFEQGEEIIELRCGHFFHKKCHDLWCQAKGHGARCPVCRTPLAQPEVVVAGQDGDREVVYLEFRCLRSRKENWWLR